MNTTNLSDEALEQAAQCLKTIAHPVRLRIIELLAEHTYTVGELAEACNVPSSQCSEHLKLMQRCGLFTNTREGRKVHYHIAEEHLHHLLSCIKMRFSA